MNTGRSTSILFRGYSLLVISFFIVVFTVMSAFLNPKVESSKQKETQAPGDIIVHILWPNGDIDVDLWMMGPDEPVAVGYTNKGGLIWNLLRDDLGAKPDATPINYEDGFTRGIVPGEYIINVQCYRCNQATFPMTVDVGVSIRDRSPASPTQQLKPLVTTKVILKADGQEKTAVRFKVDENLVVDPETINNVYYRLRGDIDKQQSSPLTIPDYYKSKPFSGEK